MNTPKGPFHHPTYMITILKQRSNFGYFDKAFLRVTGIFPRKTQKLGCL
jgi:hypothetical protein